MTAKVTKDKPTSDPVAKRLDALIRLFIELNKPKGKEKFTEGDAARLLRSLDFSPTEIAKILGKKSATDVSKYLYVKKETEEPNVQAKANSENGLTKEIENKPINTQESST
jgi:hypothetical protein